MTSVNLQTSNMCVDSEALKLFNMNRIPPTKVTNGTCGMYYGAGGSCVSVPEVRAELQNRYDWLRRKAIDARDYNQQRANASVYFAVRNGQMTKMEAQTRMTLNSSPVSSILSTLTNIVASIASKAGAIFGGMPDWVSRNFNNGMDAINPCFQAWQNMTDSSYCVFTSSNGVSRVENGDARPDNRSPRWRVSANVRSFGETMRKCNALIDTYCTLSYGISTASASRPFNQTFNWGDNSGLDEKICVVFAGLTNSTAATDVAVQDLLHMDLFHTNWVRFVPSAEAIANLGAFLTNKEFDKEPREYGPLQSTPSGIGLGVMASTNSGVEVDLVEVSRSTGAPLMTYNASKIAVGMVMTILAMIL